MEASRRARAERFLPPTLVCLAAIALSLSLMLIRPAVIARLDRGIYDIFLLQMMGGEPSPVPILVDIDERSLEALGQWPWPRYITAEIAAALYEAGARAIGMDFLMSEPDRTSLSRIASELAENFGAELDISGAPPELADNDAYFASIISQIPAVAGVYLTESGGEERAGELRAFPVTEIREDGAPPLASFLPEGSGAIMPVKSISDAVSYHALMNAEGDDDGVFRRVPLVLNCGGRPVPGLALATLALAAGDKGVVARVSRHGPLSIRVAGIDVPVSRGGMMPVVFRGAGGTMPTYSAVDVLDGAIDPSLIAGRVVFFGSTAAGLRDLRPTPFDNNYPGIELHAAAVDTILSERFVVEADWAAGLNIMLVPLLCVVMTAIFWGASPKLAFPCLALSVAMIWLAAEHMMIARNFWVSPLYSMLAIVLAAFGSFSLRFWLNERDKRVLRRAFANYVSPEVVERIVERGGIASLAGETRRISVLFTDVRGFTSMTERMTPTDVSEMLGMYFSPMTQIVRSTGGTLDKFVGDALMAFWNAPLDVADHPSVAVGALLSMHDALGELNRELEARFGVRIRMGGGIHTGDAHVGNMGTADLMDYTALGDTVNTASRVEGMCSKYGMGAVISGDTADLLRGDDRYVIRTFDMVRLKGRASGMPICTVYRREEAASRAEELEMWRECFDRYVAGDFAHTLARCRELEAMRPDEKLYSVFASRAESMMRERPAEWDGIYTYDSK